MNVETNPSCQITVFILSRQSPWIIPSLSLYSSNRACPFLKLTKVRQSCKLEAEQVFAITPKIIAQDWDGCIDATPGLLCCLPCTKIIWLWSEGVPYGPETRSGGRLNFGSISVWMCPLSSVGSRAYRLTANNALSRLWRWSYRRSDLSPYAA